MTNTEREALYRAAINCPHEIDHNRVVLHYDDKQPGRNALAQLGDRLASAQQAADGEYKRMFEDAVRSLAAIDEALGIDPDEAGGAAPILEAIEALKAGQQPTPPGFALVPIVMTAAMINAWSDGVAVTSDEVAARTPYQEAWKRVLDAAPPVESPAVAALSDLFELACEWIRREKLNNHTSVEAVLNFANDVLSHAAQPQPMTDAARELIAAAKDVLANGHQHDVGGGDVFLGTCDSAERLQRALAEIERIDREGGQDAQA